MQRKIMNAPIEAVTPYTNNPYANTVSGAQMRNTTKSERNYKLNDAAS